MVFREMEYIKINFLMPWSISKIYYGHGKKNVLDLSFETSSSLLNDNFHEKTIHMLYRFRWHWINKNISSPNIFVLLWNCTVRIIQSCQNGTFFFWLPFHKIYISCTVMKIWNFGTVLQIWLLFFRCLENSNFCMLFLWWYFHNVWNSKFRKIMEYCFIYKSFISIWQSLPIQKMNCELWNWNFFCYKINFFVCVIFILSVFTICSNSKIHVLKYIWILS